MELSEEQKNKDQTPFSELFEAIEKEFSPSAKKYKEQIKDLIEENKKPNLSS